MALKKSVDELRKARDSVKRDVEETRSGLRDLRPRPIRDAVAKRMGEIRPLKRMRRSLAAPVKEDEPSGEDST